jgi:phage host-nuclease inhibitor protein Gam
MATRLKTKAIQTGVPQSKDACAADIRRLGDLQRDIERRRTQMNDEIAAITAAHQPALDGLAEQVKALQTGIQAWCEAHRVELCGEGDRLGKTANLITGEVSWRIRPPSISIRGADPVLETLTRMGLHRFIRTKQEPNKEAMLNEPAAVRGIAGITINTGVEDFIVTPFEVEVQ